MDIYFPSMGSAGDLTPNLNRGYILLLESEIEKQKQKTHWRISLKHLRMMDDNIQKGRAHTGDAC